MSNPLQNRSWLAFSDDTPEDAARRRFLERFGHPPAEVHHYKGLLWLGPVDGRGPQAEPQVARPAGPGLLRRAEAAHRPLTPERARQLILNLEEVQR